MDVTSVHDAVTDATIHDPLGSEKSAPKSTVVAVRIPVDVKDHCEEICQTHGITIGAFLKHCCAGLVRDYVGHE